MMYTQLMLGDLMRMLLQYTACTIESVQIRASGTIQCLGSCCRCQRACSLSVVPAARHARPIDTNPANAKPYHTRYHRPIATLTEALRGLASIALAELALSASAAAVAVAACSTSGLGQAAQNHPKRYTLLRKKFTGCVEMVSQANLYAKASRRNSSRRGSTDGRLKLALSVTAGVGDCPCCSSHAA